MTSKLERILVIALLTGVLAGLTVASVLLRSVEGAVIKGGEFTSHDSDGHGTGKKDKDKKEVKDDDGEEKTDKEDKAGDKAAAEEHDKKQKDKDSTPKVFMDCKEVCWDKCEQKYVHHDIPDKCKDKWVKKTDDKKDKCDKKDDNPIPDEEQAKCDKKNGNNLTVKINLKYLHEGKWYKKVHLDIGKFSKFYDWSKKPSSVTVKHLKIPAGHSFQVRINNYLTDDGESKWAHNTQCKCPVVISMKVP